MKILYYHQHFSTPDGSTGTRSYEMARSLIARGHEVTIICGSYNMSDTGLTGCYSHGSRKGDVDGIHVIELALPYKNKLGLLQRTWTFIKFAIKGCSLVLTRDYDLIFATSTPLTAGIPGIVAKILRRKAFVFEVRDLWPELPKALGVIQNPFVLWAMSLLERLTYHCADACIGLSPGMVQGIRKRSTPTKRIAMIPNGCDLRLFPPPAPRKGTPRDSSRPLQVIFSGAHGLANGLDAVLDTANILNKRGSMDVEFIFIGDGKQKSHLIARAENEGLTNCQFLTPLPKIELSRLLNKCDLGMMVLENIPEFYYGTSPNKFFDYIASGLPVINNYPGWVANLITEHHCGFTVPPDNATFFADTLERISSTRDMLTLMSQNARHLAESEFGREQLSDIFCNLLEEVAV